MKSTLFPVVILSLVLSIGLASAALEIKSITLPATVTHNQDVAISFTLVNTDATAYTSVTFAESTTSMGTWKTLPPATAIAAGETKTLSAVLNVPAQARGTINAQLKAKTETNVQATPLPITIAINNTPLLALGTIKEVNNAQNGTINVTNNGNMVLNNVEVSASGNAKVALSALNFPLAIGASKTVDINVLDLSALTFGDNSLVITARDTTEAAAKATATFNLRKSFCSTGVKGTNLSITDVNIESNGDDDDEWKLIIDEITVDVEVENNGNKDIDSTIELGLFDSAGRNVVGKLDFINSEEEEFDVEINEDDSETVTFKFRVSGDLDDGNYKLAVKAFEEGAESALCTDVSSDLDTTSYENVKVVREEDEDKRIAFEDTAFSPTEATCGDTVTLSARAVNIGDEDEDRVKVKATNAELKIDASQELRNLDKGDDESVSFTIPIPQNVQDKTFMVELTAEYDYRSAGYHQVLSTPYRVPLKVFGCTTKPTTPQQQNPVTISAVLESDARSGAQMVVKATLKNPGSQPITVLLNAKGHESWAKLADISQRIVTLAPGESKDISLTFDVNKSAVGEQTFMLEATVNDRVQTQQVAVTLEKKTSSLFDTLGENKLAWIIGIVNLLLIIIIIIVAIKISQR